MHFWNTFYSTAVTAYRRVELLDSIWKMEPAQTTNIVDVYVNYLRRKLQDSPPGLLLRTDSQAMFSERLVGSRLP